MREFIMAFGDALYNEDTGEAVFKPTIKQELIRCRDCAHYKNVFNFGNKSYYYCYKWHGYVEKDDFCSNGVKNEEKEADDE